MAISSTIRSTASVNHITTCCTLAVCDTTSSTIDLCSNFFTILHTARLSTRGVRQTPEPTALESGETIWGRWRHLCPGDVNFKARCIPRWYHLTIRL
jgi:hypothetical protein